MVWARHPSQEDRPLRVIELVCKVQQQCNNVEWWEEAMRMSIHVLTCSDSPSPSGGHAGVLDALVVACITLVLLNHSFVFFCVIVCAMAPFFPPQQQDWPAAWAVWAPQSANPLLNQWQYFGLGNQQYFSPEDQQYLGPEDQQYLGPDDQQVAQAAAEYALHVEQAMYGAPLAPPYQHSNIPPQHGYMHGGYPAPAPAPAPVHAPAPA
jgi:hypothetical protein